MTGQVDSVVAVTSRIIAKDTTAIVPALEAAQALINAPPAAGATPATTDTTNRGGAPGDTTGAAAVSPSRAKEALPFLEYAMKYGDPQAKENAAALLYTAGAKLLQSQPQDLAGAAELLRLAVQNANPAGKVGPASNYLLGLATLFQVPQLDPQAEKTEVLRHRQADGDPAGRVGDRAHCRPRGEPGGGGQEPRHHQAVQAESGIDEEGVLQIGKTAFRKDSGAAEKLPPPRFHRW